MKYIQNILGGAVRAGDVQPEETVLCVEYSKEGGGKNAPVAVGTDRGQFLLCDARSGSTPYRRRFPADVASVCFPPGASTINTHHLYVSSGPRVHCLDSRDLTRSVREYDAAEDDVTQVVTDARGASLLVSDDAGSVTVTSASDGRLLKRLRRHENIASGVAVHPERPWHAFSAGFDCRLVEWDVGKGRALASLSMTDVPAPPPTGAQPTNGVQGGEMAPPSPYLLNPPFVHSLDVEPARQSGSGGTLLLAAGCEDGLVRLFDTARRHASVAGVLAGAHRMGVAAVRFAGRGVLVTGGNDSRVCVWKLRCTASGEGGEGGESSTAGARQGQRGAGRGGRGSREMVGGPSATPLSSFEHLEKVNWLSVSPDNTHVAVAAHNEVVLLGMDA